MSDFEKVAVIGLGYIGLPTAALIASRGFKVIGIDTNPDIVKTVASGAIHIAEPDLDGLVQKVVSNGSLTTTLEPVPADVFMIAVPTPIDEENRPDLSCVMAAVDRITDLLVPGNLLILESTSPVGTTEKDREEDHGETPGPQCWFVEWRFFNFCRILSRTSAAGDEFFRSS